MIIEKNKNIKAGIILLFVLALAGGIFFMPMQLNGKYTCFYHRIFNKNQPVSTNYAGNGIRQSNNQKRPGEAFYTMHNHGDDMIDMYISRYALFWWFSVALLIYCIYRYRYVKKKL